jgi:hypothetical protein
MPDWNFTTSKSKTDLGYPLSGLLKKKKNIVARRTSGAVVGKNKFKQDHSQMDDGEARRALDERVRQQAQLARQALIGGKTSKPKKQTDLTNVS